MPDRKPSWDDRDWEQVWDHLLGPVERYHIVRYVWAGTVPDHPFERRVAVEFARRWRRRAIWLLALWCAWLSYWFLSLVAELRWVTDRPPPSYPYLMALVGIVGAVVCLVGRHRAQPVAAAPSGDGPTGLE